MAMNMAEVRCTVILPNGSVCNEVFTLDSPAVPNLVDPANLIAVRAHEQGVMNVLRAHMQAQHAGLQHKVLVCPQCAMQFGQERKPAKSLVPALIEHLQLHVQNKW